MIKFNIRVDANKRTADTTQSVTSPDGQEKVFREVDLLSGRADPKVAQQYLDEQPTGREAHKPLIQIMRPGLKK